MPVWLQRAALALALAAAAVPAAPAPAPAALPPMDARGNETPSLAPMLEQVTPAVVNVATKGTVAVQQNPLL